ncbi:epimerase, partial [Rhodococcus fascians]|nr:epimerase [Rhodococcus fascians]MBY4071131.1 epimerase [Rhodococcus fascians]
MRIVIFGATGMIGQGVLEACLRDEQVTDVLAVGR